MADASGRLSLHVLEYVTYVPVFLSRFRGTFQRSSSNDRTNDVAQLVLGTFLAVEAKTAIPDVSNIDIGLTNGDEAALFHRDHR